ncbi:uncharacterized protein LOC143604512 [Bidens hawaiensis]|uniref:uncharacterized protein LOC143604512 n=2 Tax=Bidens hawaiensis TaxID=980011 RepID=UPI00404B216B
MGEQYWRYGASSDRATYTGYTPSDSSTLPSQQWRTSHTDLSSSSLIQKDILGTSVGACPEPASNGYPSTYEDPYLVGRRDIIHGSGPGISSILNDRPDSLTKADVGWEFNVLFVDALPSDCSRREVSHLFRPFPGFKEIRLVHKEPRHSADKPMVLCFVEFTDANRALTAMEALQGYKFDNKKPDSPSLRIHFAHFPFKLPSDDDARVSSQAPPDGARFPSQPSPNGARYSSQLLPDSAAYPSKLPHGSAHISSQKPPSSYYSSSQLPPDSAVFSSQLPPNSAHVPSQLSVNSAHSPYRLLSHREEQDVAVLREKALVVEDEEPVVKKKFKREPSKNKESAEANKNQEKRFCIKCKQNHYGECYSFKNCYICGQPGHIGKECTSKPRLCYGCGEAGHIHSLCPNGPKHEKKGKGSGASAKKGPPKK